MNTTYLTRELINSLQNNDVMKFEQSFHQVMANKISNSLTDRRNELAKTIFNESSFNDAFEKANQKMHPAETGSWGHEHLVKYGFTTDTPPQQGFVRSYNYKHKDGTTVAVHNGVNSNYWDATNPDNTKVSQYYGNHNKKIGSYDMLWSGLNHWLSDRYPTKEN